MIRVYGQSAMDVTRRLQKWGDDKDTSKGKCSCDRCVEQRRWIRLERKVNATRNGNPAAINN